MKFARCSLVVLLFLAGCGRAFHKLTPEQNAQMANGYPAYCNSPDYGNSLACLRSAPAFCSSPLYANVLACEGSKPAYCASPQYRNTLACVL